MHCILESFNTNCTHTFCAYCGRLSIHRSVHKPWSILIIHCMRHTRNICNTSEVLRVGKNHPLCHDSIFSVTNNLNYKKKININKKNKLYLNKKIK